MHNAEPHTHGRRGSIWLLTIVGALWLSLAYAGTAVATAGTPPGDHEAAPPGEASKAHDSYSEVTPSDDVSTTPPEEHPYPEQPPTSVVDEDCEEKPAHPTPPEYPSTPDYPSTPEKPDSPDKPDYPDTPDYPDKPDYPDYPDKPDSPDSPSTPDTPGYPTSPESPSVPQQPSAPEQPATPTQPVTPVTPVTPTQPTGDQPTSSPDSTQPEGQPLQAVEEDRGSVEAGQKSEDVPNATDEGNVATEETIAVAGQTGSAAGTLPFTGAESLIVALLGLMALGLGAGLREAVGPKD